jgi:DNA modification methylase
MSEFSLAKISFAKQALAEARDITEIVKIRDAAVAAHAWATARGADEAAQMAMEIKLRAERKAGEFLKEMKEVGILHSGRPKENASTLEGLKIDEHESHRWQRMASIPQERFEDYISNARTITQNALLSAAKEIDQLVNNKEYHWINDLELYNVWHTFQLNGDFGEDYPGRTPHQILVNLLYYFTDEGDLVVDPMAGGGTTIDVCRMMNRRCKAYDIQPIKTEIEKNDILNGIPINEADFVFLDPPYYNMKKEDYAISSFTESLPSFFYAMRIAIKNCWLALKNQGIMAILICPQQWRTEVFEDHIFSLTKMALEQGFTEIYRISAPNSMQQYAGYDVIQAKEKKAMMTIIRDIVIFQKGR